MQQVGDSSGEAAALSQIGASYEKEKIYTKALEYYQQALIIGKEKGFNQSVGIGLDNVGKMYAYQGDYVKALENYQAALNVERDLGLITFEGETLYNLGFAYQQKGDEKLALNYYKQAMQTIEQIRSTAGSEEGRISYASKYRDLYDHSVNLYYQQGDAQSAFNTSERGRARAFLDSVSTGYIEISDQASAALIDQEQETYAIHESLWAALQNARTSSPIDEQRVADLEEKLKQAESNYQLAVKAIEEHNIKILDLIPGRNNVLNLSQTQSLLNEQDTLVSYWVSDEKVIVFILTRETFSATTLDIKHDELLSAINDFRSFPNLDAQFPESAIFLYNKLIAPVRENLRTNHLIIIPNGILNYLPFAALTDGKSYLGDTYTITYLPSASIIPYIQNSANNTKGDKILILANPQTNIEKFSDLKYAEQESQYISQVVGTQAQIVSGENATESFLKSNTTGIKILHLAAHGQYNDFNPLYSSIILAPDKQDDGFLEVHEIYKMDLSKTDMVVLSACETQLGKVSAGDDVVGLTRSFMFSGTPTVVASLWSVNDQATALLMQKFYSYYQDGKGKADALRLAQWDVREKYPNPYYWAGFVITGDAGKISSVSYQDLTAKEEKESNTKQKAVPESTIPDCLLLPLICGGALFILIGYEMFFSGIEFLLNLGRKK